jgi:hypothetical protein
MHESHVTLACSLQEAIRSLLCTNSFKNEVQVRSTSPEWVETQFKDASGSKAPATVVQFICTMAMALIDNRSFVDEEWVGSLMLPYLSPHMGEPDSKAAAQAFVDSCRKEVRSPPGASNRNYLHASCISPLSRALLS